MSLPVATHEPPSGYANGSSEWWIEQLSGRLNKRLARLAMLDGYYRGTNSLATLAGNAWRESELAVMFPDYLHANHAKLIVNAAAHRLVVIGFRLSGELRADTEAARIWLANGMDAESDKAHTESLVKGECPVLVEPGPDPTTPLITPQDPAQVIVWNASGDRRIRLAALKTWWGAESRRRQYILYLPDRIERWQDRDAGQMDRWLYGLFGTTAPRWTRLAVEPNPLGEVPLVVLVNDPRLSGAPQGEHEPVLSRIDHYNKTLMNMAVTSNELAYPQRWAKGVETDEGEVPLDVYGDPLALPPRPVVTTGQTRWVTTRSPLAEFGQFSAATMDNYIKELQEIRGGIGTETFTPYHYLLNMPSSVAPSGDAITTLEAPLVDKVRGHARDKGVAWRDIMRLAFRLAGDEKRAAAMQTGRVLWADPERHTEAQHIDALGKMRVMLGVPQEAAWEMIPVAPEEIERWRRIAEEEAAAAPTIVVAPNVAGAGSTSLPVEVAQPAIIA